MLGLNPGLKDEDPDYLAFMAQNNAHALVSQNTSLSTEEKIALTEEISRPTGRDRKRKLKIIEENGYKGGLV